MLHVELTGAGIPLVFLHAFPLSGRMWNVNKAPLSKNFRLITPDLPGFGQSALIGETATMEDMARQILITLDQLKIQEKIVLAGLSMGGYVIFPLLRLAPERVRAVAFFSTRSASDSPEGREKRFKNIELLQKEGMNVFADRMVPALLGASTVASNPAVAAEVRQLIQSARPEAVSAALRGMAERPDSTGLLDSLRIPALFLAGEEDTIIPSVEMETISKRVSRSEFHRLPKAGHLINLEQPVHFQELFLQFLKRRVL